LLQPGSKATPIHNNPSIAIHTFLFMM